MPFQKRNIRKSQRKKIFFKTIDALLGRARKIFSFSWLSAPSRDSFVKVIKKMEALPPLLEMIPQEDLRIAQEKRDPAPVQSFEAVQQKRISRSWKMMILFLIFLIGGGGFVLMGIFSPVFSSSFALIQRQIIVSTLGEELPTDEHGLTNILLLGVGGKGHSGENLSDTIILLSLDSKTHSLSMLSLPRDLYLPSYEIEGEKRMGRINEVFRDGINYWRRQEKDEEKQKIAASQYIKDTVTKITGYQIQRFAVVDFHGFIELVDALGGVTVDVEKDIYDSTYPNEDYGYEVFSLSKGIHVMDGETSLKYVRSRHGTSDFDRSKRQKKVIAALKEEAIEKGVLTNPQKIRQFLSIIENNFWSDLSWGEMVSIAGETFQIPSSSIFSAGVTDTPDLGSGGFLYTPPREEFNNASVFLTFLNGEPDPYAQIKFFAEVVFENRGLLTDPPKVAVLNTTKRAGLAGSTAQHLMRYGITVGMVGNADVPRAVTTVEYWNTPEISALIPILQRKMTAVFTPVDPAVATAPGTLSTAPITLYIGEDFSTHDYRGTLLRNPLPRGSFSPVP